MIPLVNFQGFFAVMAQSYWTYSRVVGGILVL